MPRHLRTCAAAVLVLLPLALWAAGSRSSAAAVAHAWLLLPSIFAAGVALLLALRARRRLAAAAALAVLCPALALSAVRAAQEAQPAAAARAAPTLAVVTYNLLFSSHADASVALLRDAGADVLCVQEVTPAWARRLDATLADRYPHRALEPRAGAYGLAIYSRLPLSSPTLVRDERRVAGQCVELGPGGAGTVLCNVHLSSPAGIVQKGAAWIRGFDANARVRAAQWTLLRRHVARRYPAARHLVVAGDFNTLEAEPLYRTIRGDLVDAFAAAGSGQGATFPTEPTSPVPLFRIDYVFASPALAPVAAEVLPPAGSDHRGLRAVLALPVAAPAPRREGTYSSSSKVVPPGPVVKRTSPR